MTARRRRLPHAGEEGQALAESALLLRDAEGTPSAFFNVCRHRGHELLEAGEAASGERVACPYHGWEYALDGRLRSAPRLGRRASFQHGWRGWVGAGSAFRLSASFKLHGK